jgi:hypothetical protein
MNTKILELENMIESDFNPELFEKKAYEISRQLDDVDDFICLAHLARWAEFDDEDKGAEMGGNIMDRGIELAVQQKDKAKLEEIVFELEAGMELDELATEVKNIIKNI